MSQELPSRDLHEKIREFVRYFSSDDDAEKDAMSLKLWEIVEAAMRVIRGKA